MLISTDNFPPNISGNGIFTVRVGQNNSYYFTVQDPGDNITVSVVGGLPTNAFLEESNEGHYTLRWSPTETSNATLTLLATDSLGALSTLTPRVHVCACFNGGNCTLEGVISTDNSTIVLNCDCTEGNE